jgi:gliding motility-associated protein GldE
VELDFQWFQVVFDGVSVHPITASGVFALIISILLLFCSAIISASEIAFFSLEPHDIEQMEVSSNRAEKNIYRLLQHPQRLLATMLIGLNFANIGVVLLLSYFTESVLDFSNAPLIGFLFDTILITFSILLFGEVVPKIYAAEFSIKIAWLTVPVLSFLDKALSPFVSVLVSSTAIVNRSLSKYNKSNISIEELSHALELTTNSKDEDTELLEGIINFGNIQVVEIMTSRVDMVNLDIKMNYKQVIDVIIQSGYSRIPVYSGTRDNIKGILYGKDLLSHIDKPAYFRWQSLIRQAYYVPETKKINDLLDEFQKNKIHLAIVVDEYGGTLGLITMEDIVEEIIGDISDEYDEEEKLYTRLDDSSLLFEAKIQLNDFFKIEDISEEDFIPYIQEVETLAGMILEIKGDIPSENEKIQVGKYCFEIMAVDQRRIQRIRLTISDDMLDKQ